MAIFGLKRKKEQLEVPLEALSVLWRPKVSEAEQSQQEIEVEGNFGEVRFENEACNELWREVVLPEHSSPAMLPLMPAIESALRVLDSEDGGTSSVVDDYETDEEYDCLKQVTLRDHSIGVCRRLVTLVRDKTSNPLLWTSRAVLVGLCHDIGKLQDNKATKAYHSYNSYKWLQEQLDGLANTGMMLDAVKLHHAPDNMCPSGNILLPLLKEADRKQRQKELRQVKGAEEKKEESGSAAEQTVEVVETEELVTEGTGESEVKKETQAEGVESTTLIGRLAQRVSCKGFDAFYWQQDERAMVFVKPSVVRQILGEGIGSSPEEQLVGWMQENIGGELRKVKLKYTNRKMKPARTSYFIFPAELFEGHNLDREPPRDVPEKHSEDVKGRWLAKAIIQGEKTEQ